MLTTMKWLNKKIKHTNNDMIQQEICRIKVDHEIKCFMRLECSIKLPSISIAKAFILYKVYSS